jgi:hypothetical protein
MTRRRGAILNFRRLAFAVALCAGAGVATAQTVAVRNVAPGSTVELVLNSTVIGSIAADDRGNATLVVPQAPDAKAEAPPDPRVGKDVLLFLDVCENRHRFLIVERGAPAAALETGCVRREIPGLYIIRPLSTLVVNAGEATPTVLLRQRPYNPDSGPRAWRASPEGLVLSGGGSHTKFSEAANVACGNVTDCYRDEAGLGFGFGVAYWFLPYLAAEASYLRPVEVSALGAEATYDFASTLDADVLMLAGMTGFPAGPLRVYGKGGLTYHRATFSTTQTINDRTITIDDVPQTVPGGTQTLAFRTTGWGWMFGGGLETWLTRSFSFYGEVGWAKLKGEDKAGGEGVIDESLMMINFGVKVHVGR